MDRRAAWLAWSLAALSVALLVGGIALSTNVQRQSHKELPLLMLYLKCLVAI